MISKTPTSDLEISSLRGSLGFNDGEVGASLPLIGEELFGAEMDIGIDGLLFLSSLQTESEFYDPLGELSGSVLSLGPFTVLGHGEETLVGL